MVFGEYPSPLMVRHFRFNFVVIEEHFNEEFNRHSARWEVNARKTVATNMQMGIRDFPLAGVPVIGN
jgi:hypothetical protein